MAIQVGDEVTIIFSPEAGGGVVGVGTGFIYKVEVIRSTNPGQSAFWELSTDNRSYVFDCPLILRKVNPLV